MSEEKVVAEGIQVVIMDKPELQFQMAKDENLPAHLVLVSFGMQLGFAIPFEEAHQLSHLIHDALEALGGELHIEPEDTEIPKNKLN